MYNPKFMAPLYEKWDNAVIKWAIDNLGIPVFSRTKWYRHSQRVLAPIASGGLGLNGLQRRSHAGWLCAWSTVLDTFKSNENRHTCNIGVTRYIDDMIKYLDLTETEGSRTTSMAGKYGKKHFYMCCQSMHRSLP